MSARNYSGWPFSNFSILSSYISEPAADGLRLILILMMSHSITSSLDSLISGIGGGSILYITLALSQAGFEWIFMVVYLNGIGEM